ncbi:MAG: hypothetical protein HND48_09440 [Chloroflexi bacterium]|nr:hypothetical protein [Chloroflexota bacterium]
MALLDAACRLDGVSIARENWEWLRGAVVALHPAERVVVNNTFIKVLRPRRTDSKSKEEGESSEVGSADAGFFGRTIAYREYAQIDGVFSIALEVQRDEHALLLNRWLPMIQYLGKRGGFVQMVSEPATLDNLSPDYLLLDGEPRPFDLDAMLTQLDDAGDELTFERANIYSDEKMTIGKHRLFRTVALPYQVARSSRGYTDYRLVRKTEDQE